MPIKKMNHYYFKFGTQNEIFLELKKKTDWDKENINLSIYYDYDGCKWKANPKHGENGFKEVIEYCRNNGLSRGANQIEVFNGLKSNNSDCYFWIFEGEDIYVFKGVDLNPKDGTEKDSKGSYPKYIEAKLYNQYKKINLPEFFSNINSNQKYNRGTIGILSKAEADFATALVTNEKTNVTRNNFHEYLSPIEFETVIFQIFNRNGNFCSTIRGGTLKDYDLKVKVNNPFSDFLKGTFWLQLKNKTEKKTQPENCYLIHSQKISGKNERVFGIEWIREQIEKDELIKEWLKEMTFNYKEIQFTW